MAFTGSFVLGFGRYVILSPLILFGFVYIVSAGLMVVAVIARPSRRAED